MAEDAENHTVRLLQEMRSEIRGIRSDMQEFRAEVNGRFDESNLRMDGMTHMITLLAANIAGHDHRIEALEEATGIADT